MAADEAISPTNFDCSGRAETHAGVVVAGCVSAGEQWERMKPDWNRTLEQEGVREIGGFRALHMKGLAASKRALEGWSEPFRKGNPFLRLLVVSKAGEVVDPVDGTHDGPPVVGAVWLRGSGIVPELFHGFQTDPIRRDLAITSNSPKQAPRGIFVS